MRLASPLCIGSIPVLTNPGRTGTGPSPYTRPPAVSAGVSDTPVENPVPDDEAEGAVRLFLVNDTPKSHCDVMNYLDMDEWVAAITEEYNALLRRDMLIGQRG